MKAKFKFEIMNALGAVLQDEEFKVAYYILNRLALEDTNRVKIYRAMLADLTGKSERTISRITDKLDEKGIIKKDTVSDSKNRYNYYSIHPNIEQQLTQNNTKLGHEEQETTPNLVTDDRFNKKEKNNKNIKNKINIKENFMKESENPLDGFSSSSFDDEMNRLFDKTLSDKKGKPLEVYQIFAEKGQEQFNWLCRYLNENNEDLYKGTRGSREHVARHQHLTIPTVHQFVTVPMETNVKQTKQSKYNDGLPF